MHLLQYMKMNRLYIMKLCDQWKKVMESEMDSLKKNDVWELVDLPKGKKILENKSVFRIKQNAAKKLKDIKQIEENL